MPNKTQEYLNLAQQTANGLTRYWESWTDYLTTASRLYKYPFADQLMIYAQRPDATACADFDIWNNRMNRYVRRGAKGIALLDESSGFPRLHYVFDVSDTGVRRNSRDPDLWQYNDDLKRPVSDALTAAYGISHERVSQQLADIAGKLVADYWDNNGGDMLKEGFYHRPLTVIRPIDIENFLKGMRRDGRSDSYISKARGMLYQIFQKAEANDLVRRNPVRLAEKMRASGTAKRKEAFTTAEVAHLMKVLPDDRMGLSIRLLLGTGMRMQELLALEPQFIEEDGSVIHIRQAVKVVKGTVSIGSPKSKDSIRDIPVPLNVRPCAIKLRDTTDQFIWESPKTGLPCNPTHFRDVFRKSLEEAGDVRLLTPHSCRHTYVSQMQALGVDIQTIQSIVGHADTEMTEHYLHVQESIRQSAIQLFSEAFSA